MLFLSYNRIQSSFLVSSSVLFLFFVVAYHDLPLLLLAPFCLRHTEFHTFTIDINDTWKSTCDHRKNVHAKYITLKSATSWLMHARQALDLGFQTMFFSTHLPSTHFAEQMEA